MKLIYGYALRCAFSPRRKFSKLYAHRYTSIRYFFIFSKNNSTGFDLSFNIWEMIYTGERLKDEFIHCGPSLKPDGPLPPAMNKFQILRLASITAFGFLSNIQPNASAGAFRLLPGL
jgi:hypothetical protein